MISTSSAGDGERFSARTRRPLELRAGRLFHHYEHLCRQNLEQSQACGLYNSVSRLKPEPSHIIYSTLVRLMEFPSAALARVLLGSQTVVADCFHGTILHCFPAQCFFVRPLRLAIHIGVAGNFVALENIGCNFSTLIAINALVIYVEPAESIFRVSICNICHMILVIRAGKARLFYNYRSV